MVCMSATLFFVLPRDGAKPTEERYDAILLSIPRLFWRDRVLLVRGLLALLIFAAFSTLWTALVLPLSSEPFGYSHTGVGLLGLVGLAGALAAGSAGKLADRGLAQVTTGTSLALLVCSWALIAILSTSIPALIVGIVVLDLAVQAVHVSNQAILVARHPEAGSRLIGGYMVFYSIGSALGAVVSTAAYASAGWAGVSVLGASISVAGLALWAATVGVR
jgi:predicted MFS family arabinose efflux permease